MTALGKTEVLVPKDERDGANRLHWKEPILVLGLLAATHYVVDLVAGTVNPLWPDLEQIAGGPGNILGVYIPWMIATSFSQLAFGALADRFSLRWLIWGGPAAALVCLSCIGWAPNTFWLATLFVLGGLGIAAFHPEAAALAGSLLPAQRSRAMAVFALSGYLGQSCGPLYSGWMTENLGGLPALGWGLTWGGAILVVLAISLSFASSQPRQSKTASLPRRGKLRPSVLVLLLAIGSLRITPALGVPFTLAFLLSQGGASGTAIGVVQSAFMAGIGLGAMTCAAFVKRAYERTTIWLLPLCAAPILLALTQVQGTLLTVLVAVSGLLLGITMPIYISYGQQLIPQSQRIASSITMGVSWGVAAGLQASIFELFRSFGTLPQMFLFFAGMCVASSFLCIWLPQPETADQE